MKIYLALITIGVFLSSQAFAVRECKTSRRLSVAQQIANLGPDGDLDLVDVDLFPGGSIAAGYEYEVEPAFTNGLYFRTDRWQVKLKATPEDQINISEGVDFGLSGGLTNQLEATFIRSFHDPCQAMFATPYTPVRVPLTVKIATGEKFKKGDYFLLRASLGLVISGELLNMLGSSWGITLGASYLMEGYYQLQIVRIDETKVRLKVIAQRGRNLSASVGVGYRDVFEVFGVKLIDKTIKRWVETNPIKVEASSDHDRVLMVDYVLDLADPEVASAYEKLLRKIRDFKNLALASPFTRDRDIEANLLLDLTPLEDIYRADYSNNNVGRLKRNLRATSDQNSRGLGVRLGNRIIGYKWGANIATARMSVRQPDNSLDYFLMRSWDRKSDGRFLYSWFRSKNEHGVRALFTADKDYNIQMPVNIVRHENKKRNRISYREMKKMKLLIRKALPLEVEEHIPWSNWTQGRKDKFTNFGLRLQLILSPEVVINAPELTRKEIEVLFLDHLKREGLEATDYYYERREFSRDGYNGDSAQDQLERSLRYFAKLLEKTLDRDISMLERLDALTDLRKNKLFLESGFSFIMVLQPDKMKSLFNVDLNISSNESQIDLSYGDSELSTLYKKLLTIKAALDDDSLDLLREAESLSTQQPFTRIQG